MNKGRQFMSSNHDDLNLRAEFMRYKKRIDGPYRYVPTKYRGLLGKLWPDVKRLAMETEIHQETLSKPRHFEIHFTEKCQLKCVFCKGGPRSVPPKEVHMDSTIMLQLI